MAITQNTQGYCQLDDVQRYTGKTYTSATKPTSAQVESMIMERADVINGTLSALGFAVPVSTSATRASRVLLALNAKGVAADADNAVPGLQAETARAQAWRADFDRTLEALRRRTLDLSDVTAEADMPTTAANQSPSGSFNLSTAGEERDPVFDRDTDL
jgi:hypothetical protein